MLVSQSLLVAGLAALSHAVQHTVTVGNGGIFYNPDTVQAAVGDTVLFKFGDSIPHSVVEGDFDHPCQAKNGGFAVPSQQGGPTFEINITDTNSHWFYCGVSTHCKNGMVGVINPGSDQTLDQFKSSAANSGDAVQLKSLAGGQLVSGSQTSGSLGGPAAKTTTSSGSSSTASPSGSSSSSSGAAAAATYVANGVAVLAAIVALV